MTRNRNPFGFRFFGGFLVLVLGASTLAAVALSRGEDYEVRFERTVPSHVPLDRLQREMDSLEHWPDWFFKLAQARVIAPATGSKRADPKTPSQGSTLLLKIDPKRAFSHGFDLEVRVSEYVPGKRLSLELLHDSTGRLTRLFDHLEWTVELEPRGGMILIHGTELAHTHHWKSRLFGAIARKIVMNQVFYPNLISLAELGTEKAGVNLTPQE